MQPSIRPELREWLTRLVKLQERQSAPTRRAADFLSQMPLLGAQPTPTAAVRENSPAVEALYRSVDADDDTGIVLTVNNPGAVFSSEDTEKVEKGFARGTGTVKIITTKGLTLNEIIAIAKQPTEKR